jgi:hypothetical protein
MPTKLKDIVARKDNALTLKRPGSSIVMVNKRGYTPNMDDEKKFVDVHKVEKHEDRNGNGDDLFQGANIKTFDRTAMRMGYMPKADQKAEFVADRSRDHEEVATEEFEPLDELSKNTLKSYIEKAKKSLDQQTKDNNSKHDDPSKWGDKKTNRWLNRKRSMHKAEDMSENIEFDLSEASMEAACKMAGHLADAHCEPYFVHSFSHPKMPNKKVHAPISQRNYDGDPFKYRYHITNVVHPSPLEPPKSMKQSKSSKKAIRTSLGEEGDSIKDNLVARGKDWQITPSTKCADEKHKTIKAKVTKKPELFNRYSPSTKQAEKVSNEDFVNEKLDLKNPVGNWIHDFVHSDNKRFEGKSKEERIRMALGGFYAAKRKSGGAQQ